MCQIISWTGAGGRSTLASVLPHNRIITIISEPTVCVCSLTCARCRVCAGAPPQTGSDGCSVAPPSPPAASSHRSGPSGLLRHTAPWPCSSCSLSPESDTHTVIHVNIT